MKQLKSIGKMLLWMIVGGIFGGIMMFAFLKLNPEVMQEKINLWMTHVVQNIFLIQVVVAGLFILGALITLAVAQKSARKFDPTQDDDVIEEKVDRILQENMLMTSIYSIVAFLLFGVSVDKNNDYFWFSMGIFLGSFIAVVIIQLYAVNLIKKMNPTKKGDPSSMKFQKEWIESCDEAEQLLIYKSAYKTFGFMSSVYVALIVVVIFTKMLFDTGNYPILIVTTIWLFSTVHYMLTANKLSKEKVNH